MNSDGEKIPPEAPEPRLTEVANSLAANRPSRRASACQIIQQDRLDGGVADAFDEIMARKSHQRVDQHADHQHADAVAQIGISDFAENVFRKISPRMKAVAARPMIAPSSAKQQA